MAPDEVGKVLSVVTAISCASPFINAPVFGYLYIHTVQNMPNAFLWVIVAVFAVNFTLILGVKLEIKSTQKKKKQQESIAMD